MPCRRDTQPASAGFYGEHLRPANNHVTLEADPSAPVELQMSADLGDGLTAMS